MSSGVFRYSVFVAVTLFTFPFFVSATESECITTSFVGTDATLEGSVRKLLKTELKIPIYEDDGPASCWKLVIELQEKTSRISLSKRETFDTVIDLDSFLPALWPRAIALSTSGLWILAQNQARQAPPEVTEDDGKPDPQEEVEEGPREEAETKKGSRPDVKKKRSRENRKPWGRPCSLG